MPLKQVGGRLTKEQLEERNKRRRKRKDNLKKRKQKLLKQGYELKNRIFLDTSIPGILNQLKLDTSYKVSKYFIDAHGSMTGDHFKVPDNIVLMYLGVIGNVTLLNSLALMGPVCNGNVPPNSIIVPGEMAPNVSLSGEHNKEEISGIFECSSPPKRVLNDFLVPEQDVIDSYINFQGEPAGMFGGFEIILDPETGEYKTVPRGRFGFEIMKDPETGEYPISTENNYETDLEKTVHAISKLLKKNTYAFVYLDSCLSGGCGTPMTREEFNKIADPKKFNTLRTGDKLYDENPYRVETIRGSLKSGETRVIIQKMQLAEDSDHQNHRLLLKRLIDNYNFSLYNFLVYDSLEKYYEYDINDLPYFSKYANKLTTEDKDFNHFVAFTDMHVKILKAYKKKDRDKIFKLTRRDNALRFNINPIKYSFLETKYGITYMPLESLQGIGIIKHDDDATQVNKNIKDINNLANRLSDIETPPSIFLETLWKQYTENPLLRSNDDTLFPDFWFDDHEEIEKLKKKERLTKSQRIKLKKLQRQHDYYTITFLMIEIIQTIDLYKKKSKIQIYIFKSEIIPKYNMVYAKQLMTMAIEYVKSNDYRMREIAYKDKIIKQLEEMNTMIFNDGSQAGGGDDFLTSLFKFFGF